MKTINAIKSKKKNQKAIFEKLNFLTKISVIRIILKTLEIKITNPNLKKWIYFNSTAVLSNI